MFYKETDFKETSIGKIPKDWHMQTTKELGEVVTGITPSTLVKEYWDGDYPFVTPTDMTDNKYVERTERKVTVKGLEKGRLIPRDSVLVTCIASIGKMALAFEDCLTNQQINSVICKKGVNPHYVYYALGFRANILKSWAGRTTNPIIKKSLFEKFPISIPRSELEQQSIAEVLSAVDDAILQTDELAATIERLKKGLMQELLTKGIGHKEFKDTEIGKIPKEWEVIKLKDVAEIRGNKSVKGFERIAFIPMELVPESQIFAEYQIRKKEDVKSFTYCEAGDLLLAKITPSLENGKQGIVPSDVPNGIALATTEVFPICCKEIYGFFLFYVLKFSKFRNKIISSMIGTTGRQRASKESVERLEIPLPPIDEQQKIAEILSNVDKKLGLERNEKVKLERVKQGLMNFLLTGKVRVKVM